MKTPATESGLTPLMRQYEKIKAQYPDKILFFRMGDFYEMFGADAIKAAPILNVALTSRGQINGQKIPLAGIPYHAADKYLARLLAAGEKVVVVEQVEDPRLAKGVVKREVVEILTPGTATIEGVADDTSPLYLAALHFDDTPQLGLAYIDLLTGRFALDEGPAERILEALHILSPQEIIYPLSLKASAALDLLKRQGKYVLTSFEEWNYDYKTAVRELAEFFGVSTLDGFGVGQYRRGLAAAGAIYRYLRENNRTRLDHVTKITIHDSEDLMVLDYNTVCNLELVRSLSGGSERDSLYGAINRTNTVGGARRLKESLLHPFKKAAPIWKRQQALKELHDHPELGARLPALLKRLPDLARLVGRLGMRKINPRQMAAVREGITVGHEVLIIIAAAQAQLFMEMKTAYPDLRPLADLIEGALLEELPLTTARGELIRPGYSPELDDLKGSIAEARDFIASLQRTERERTGISSLKVGYNRVFGYYIEVTRPHLDKVPAGYIRKQTLVNAERFITEELKTKEELILAAEEKIFALEEKLFWDLVEKAAASVAPMIQAAEILAEIDLLVSLATLAKERHYCCPEISDGTDIEITGGRHPVIEELLPSGGFVANDLILAAEQKRIMILTGPNMSGKSTFLRQIGLIAILAQIGSYVPAQAARIGLVDRVFTRVGAIDNLARGQSTFLMEMIETSNILHNATERSLILLDEVGRGTSTFDGLSIAWAVVEHLNEQIKARTIFATHYHELTGLAALYDKIQNFQVAVKRWEDRIIFLHKIIPGGCDDSYGIEVARLAGIPKTTLTRSRELLRLLESGRFSQSELARGIHRKINQRSLFDAKPSLLEQELRKIDINAMTPLEALRILNKLRDMLDEK